jgi:hypothetical protein
VLGGTADQIGFVLRISPSGAPADGRNWLRSAQYAAPMGHPPDTPSCPGLALFCITGLRGPEAEDLSPIRNPKSAIERLALFRTIRPPAAPRYLPPSSLQIGFVFHRCTVHTFSPKPLCDKHLLSNSPPCKLALFRIISSPTHHRPDPPACPSLASLCMNRHHRDTDVTKSEPSHARRGTRDCLCTAKAWHLVVVTRRTKT